jgi:hypothetical protein
MLTPEFESFIINTFLFRNSTSGGGRATRGESDMTNVSFARKLIPEGRFGRCADA